MNLNNLVFENLDEQTLINVSIFVSTFILYYNVYLYICIILSLVNTKFLHYFYSNFHNLDLDLNFSYKNKRIEDIKDDIKEDYEKLSESSEDVDILDNMQRSVIFTNNEKESFNIENI
jgi:hypothetical protein